MLRRIARDEVVGPRRKAGTAYSRAIRASGLVLSSPGEYTTRTTSCTSHLCVRDTACVSQCVCLPRKCTTSRNKPFIDHATCACQTMCNCEHPIGKEDTRFCLSQHTMRRFRLHQRSGPVHRARAPGMQHATHTQHGTRSSPAAWRRRARRDLASRHVAQRVAAAGRSGCTSLCARGYGGIVTALSSSCRTLFCGMKMR